MSTFCTLVKLHLYKQPWKRRRTKEEIPVLHESKWNSYSLLPSYPRSFGRNHSGSNSIGQRVDSKGLVPIHLSCAKLFQHALHHCFWINCRRKSSWTRRTNGVLCSGWSNGGKLGRSRRRTWYVSTRVRLIQACVESRTRWGLLGWQCSRTANGTEVLSDQIERDHSPWHSTSNMHWKSGIQEKSWNLVYKNF